MMALMLVAVLLAQITPVPPIIPVPTPLPAQTREPGAYDEPERADCGFPPEFMPYVVQPGDTLPALLAERGRLSVGAARVAVMNCLRDTDALPVGAVIFLPPPMPTSAAPCVFLGEYSIESARLPCPDSPPRAVLIVYQPFERGWMIWMAEQRLIYALFEDGTGALFVDRYVEGQAEPPLVPPDGLFTPVRGFRAVWDALGGAESPLGWGLAPETGFDSRWQPADVNSWTIYLELPDRRLALTYVTFTGALYWADVSALSAMPLPTESPPDPR